MTTGCTVRVCGFPAELPPERVVDKLTVHFQRARNGGGEIANVELAPESPDCARVTFEEAAVAQRVLKTDKQVLMVGGKSYPLRIHPYIPGLNPNEIFVCVYMEIDYRRLPGGKEILQGLCKRHGDIVLKFRPQEMTCLAKGSFTELQAFSSELLRHFQSKQRDSALEQNSTLDQNSSPENKRSADKAGGVGSSLQGLPKAQAEKKSQKATSGGSSPRNPKENHAELLEDFSLVMDSDVYLYMRKFCQEELSSILLRHQVEMVDVSGEDIATLYLQATSQGTQGASALASARLAISRLSQQLEATLRKEKINHRDLGGVEGARRLLGELQGLCPQLLCHLDKEHLSLIGNMVEVSQAKQYVQGFVAAREAAMDHRKSDVPQAVSTPQVRGESPAPVQPVPLASFLPRRGSLPRWSSGKMGRKLATRFNASDSSASLPSSSSRDTPLVGLLPGDSSPTADYSTAETKNHTLQGALLKQTSETKADSLATRSRGPPRSLEAWRSSKHLLPSCPPSNAFSSLDLYGAEGTADPRISDLGRPNSLWLPKPDYSTAETKNHTLQGALLKQTSETKADSLATRSRGPPRSLEAWRSSKHLLPSCPPSNAFSSLDLYGAEGTADPRISDLGRPNSLWLPKPQNSRDCLDESLPGARINVDRSQQSSQEDSRCILQLEISQEGRGQEGDLQSSKQRPLSPPLPAVPRDGVSQERPSPAGVLPRPPDHICERFSYSMLAVEGPEDEALADLCSGLKACHDGVAVSQERHHLGLNYPREAKQQVLEALHHFCAQRLAVLTKQLLPHGAQQ